MPRYRNQHRTVADLRLGHQLAARRVAKGLTQIDAAERMTELTRTRWTQVTISNIERGRTPCTVVQYAQLAWLYDMEVSSLGIDPAEAAEPCVALPDDTNPRPRITS